LEQVRTAIKEQAIAIELNAAAEYYFDEGLFEKIEQKNILTFGENCVLFEFSFLQEPIKEKELIFSFFTNGYQPVLAHYERYAYYQSIHKAEELREMGVKIQMNLNSLSGHYGPKVQKQAELLIKNKLVDLVGSDCHRIEHLHILKQNLHKANFYRLLDLDLMNYRL
jgi:tyrosine-protein phosphatase YwqE